MRVPYWTPPHTDDWDWRRDGKALYGRALCQEAIVTWVPRVDQWLWVLQDREAGRRSGLAATEEGAQMEAERVGRALEAEVAA